MRSKKKSTQKSTWLTKKKQLTSVHKLKDRLKKLNVKNLIQRFINLPLRAKATFLTSVILLVLLTFTVIFFSSRRLSQSEVDNKYSEIQRIVSENDNKSVSYLESSVNFFKDYKHELKSHDQANIVEAKVRLLLIQAYSNEGNNKACNQVNNYIKQSEDEPQASIASSAKVSVNLAFSLYTASTNCEDVNVDKILKLTGFQKFEYEDKLILSYYDNIPSEKNTKWIAEEFNQNVDEVKLDDENHRDAIRIFVIKKDDFTPITYKQFRSESLNQSYFDRQFETFDFNEGKLIWKQSGEVALNLTQTL